MNVKHKFEQDQDGWWLWRIVHLDNDGMPARTWLSQRKFSSENEAKEDIELFCKVTNNGPGPLIEE